MGDKENIKQLLQEAELYQGQGLLSEARSKYDAVSDLIRNNPKIKNKQKLLAGVAKKINLLEVDSQKVERGPSSPELSSKAQDLIQKLFSFSKEESEEEAALEGALALAKFGQFERALEEFNSLLSLEVHRVVAAKNILRCHIALNSEATAADKYEEWTKGDLFTEDQLETLRVFLEQVFENKGMDRKLTKVGGKAKTEAVVDTKPEKKEEEFIDISSIGIYLDSGPGKGKVVEFDVNFQSGNLLSLIISKKDGTMIEHLEVDNQLDDLQFYSPIAIFNGTGEVAAKSEIKSGPKQGDYCLDIKITST
jgi:tetratricopeptide (TPR) repeat protein